MNRSVIHRTRWFCLSVVASALLTAVHQGQSAAATDTNSTVPAATATLSTNRSDWLSRPLSVADALNIALSQNADILRARNDLEAAHGIVVQTRAIVFPKVQATGDFTRTDPDAIDGIPVTGFSLPRDSWNTGFQLVQSIFEGGRMSSALKTARLTKEQALLQYQTVVSDVLLETRVAYYDVLLAAQQIIVNEASVALLTRELEDQRRRFEAGTVPRFNVLRAEVAVANARPALIRARNAHRIAKNNLSNLLGYDLPRDVWEDVPLRLTDSLEVPLLAVELPSAISQALERRTELGALRKAEQLQEQNVVTARAGYYPSLQAFAGYGWRSSQFQNRGLDDPLSGWSIGGQVNWNIFDGQLTRGRVIEARARHDRAKTDLDDTSRRIELEVRTAYSTYIEAREVLESQEKVREEADEALRLAIARADAGTGTQLDVLNAETSLTQARTTQILAQRDFAVARARLERAMGPIVNRQ